MRWPSASALRHGSLPCRSAFLIACTTFFCCLSSVSLGSRVGRFLSGKATVLGGILLILLGIKSLFY
ncbi:MAG: manganese efflux pump [Christensenellales bacterium]